MAESKKEKYCKGCDKTRPLTDFTKEKQRLDGRARLCKVCKNAAQKRYRQHAGRADTKAGKADAAKIKSIYIDPPLPPTFGDVSKATTLDELPGSYICREEATVGQVYNDDFLSIDMAGHRDTMDRLTEAAIRELRSPEMHALFILREALK